MLKSFMLIVLCMGLSACSRPSFLNSVDSVDSVEPVGDSLIVGRDGIQLDSFGIREGDNFSGGGKVTETFVVLSEGFSVSPLSPPSDSSFVSTPSQLLADRVESASYSPSLDPSYGVDSVAEGSVSVNTASNFELTLVPGIGVRGAELIIQNRPYTSLDELHKIKKIRKKNLEAAFPYLKL
jgi:DNA uptake protein ComE-like DNA-binding protein